jgi:hypothetical protein
MRTHFSVDRASFEEFLAGASVVQKSGQSAFWIILIRIALAAPLVVLPLTAIAVSTRRRA